MEKIQIGKIVNAVGLKGEVKVYNYSAPKERYEELSDVYVENKKHEIQRVRYSKEAVILKLSEIDDRNAAEEQKGRSLFINSAALPELPEDTYYIRDLMGVLVFDDAGNRVGTLTDVIQNRAQDLYEIETESEKKFLIPAVEEFIVRVDMENRRMYVKLIEGLM